MPANKVDGRKTQWTPERRRQHSISMRKAWARSAAVFLVLLKGSFWGTNGKKPER